MTRSKDEIDKDGDSDKRRKNNIVTNLSNKGKVEEQWMKEQSEDVETRGREGREEGKGDEG